MTEQEKILERVKKLLALAGNNNSEHEAAAAAAKAQELLLKHDLDMSMVEDSSVEVDDEGVHHTILEKNYVGARGILMKAITDATMTECVSSDMGGNHKMFHVFGKEANVEVAVYMYGYLIREINRLSPKPLGGRISNSFRLGAISTIRRRMMETFTEFQEASDQTRALVVIHNAVAVRAKEAYFDPSSLTKGKRSPVNDARAYNAGKAAGEKIPLRRGLSQQTTNVGGQHLLN